MSPDSVAHRRSSSRRRNPAAWCCTFSAAPGSPESRSAATAALKPPPPLPPKPSFYSSPSPSSKLAITRRIRSPGRVSPIDSYLIPENAVPAVRSDPPDPPAQLTRPDPEAAPTVSTDTTSLDLKMRVKGGDGRCLEIELDSRVLLENSQFFAGLARRSCSGEYWRIDVEDVENVVVFKQVIELMFEKDPIKWLARAGVSRAIDLLQVSSTIKFQRGVTSCVRYLEAAPWSESEEEKLKSLFAVESFGESVSQDVLARFVSQGLNNSDGLAIHLIKSVTKGTNTNARIEMQALVNALLSKSSVYHKEPAGLNKDNLYRIGDSCLNWLVQLFLEASTSMRVDNTPPLKETKPLVERISKQVENLNWLLEILIENQIAEDFVSLWSKQKELILMHERSSPMVRYEVSRISASIFIALGKGKIQCPGEVRSSVLGMWFRPMMMDFGWLQRCPKGLDVRVLEDGLGQALLTLPLRQQQSLFMEWFDCFSGQGTECPNLCRAFQVWWRRSFVRTTEVRS